MIVQDESCPSWKDAKVVSRVEPCDCYCVGALIIRCVVSASNRNEVVAEECCSRILFRKGGCVVLRQRSRLCTGWQRRRDPAAGD